MHGSVALIIAQAIASRRIRDAGDPAGASETLGTFIRPGGILLHGLTPRYAV